MFLEQNGTYRLIDADKDSRLLTSLEPATYNLKIHKSMFGGTNYSLEKTTVYDRGSIIKEGVYKEMWDKIEEFISPEMNEARELMQSINKMGMLFYGKPGTGKTFLAGQIGKYIRGKQENTATIIINAWDDIDNIATLVDKIREFTKDQMLVLIFDEFEKVHPNKFNNSDFLSFLDGSNSKDKVLLIATANDKSKLPTTLVERPGRFEVVMEFQTNNEETWKGIINNLFPDTLKDAEAMARTLTKVKTFKGECTIDHIRLMVRDEIVYLLKKKKGLEVEAPKALVNNVATFAGKKKKVGYAQGGENPSDSDVQEVEMMDPLQQMMLQAMSSN